MKWIAVVYIAFLIFSESSPELLVAWVPFIALPFPRISLKLYTAVVATTCVQCILYTPSTVLFFSSVILAPLHQNVGNTLERAGNA